jgi:hypothetical protein
MSFHHHSAPPNVAPIVDTSESSKARFVVDTRNLSLCLDKIYSKIFVCYEQILDVLKKTYYYFLGRKYFDLNFFIS